MFHELRILESSLSYMSEPSNRLRLGIFGGTFDPIHVGHLLLAEHAREVLRLDRVLFLPAAIAPHKLDRRASDGKVRLEMLQLAIGGNPHFAADDRELRRGGTSYTVETLAELKREIPDQELVFLMGADSLSELHTWRDPVGICQLAFVAVLARGGMPSPDMNLLGPYMPHASAEQLAAHLVPMPQIEISSSDIRRRIAAGQSVRYQLHPAVAAYVAAQKLYTSQPSSTLR